MAREPGVASAAVPASRRRLRILLAVSLLGPAGAAAPGPAAVGAPAPDGASRERATRPALRWPLDRPPAIVSSFGEYRYDHMHAGIDISTGGSNGLKVRAVDGGKVVRLKVEWRGYGRALYLRHPDGRTTVYAHLERFEDATLGLERIVKRRQAAAGTRYPGDVHLDPAIPVSRGQVIAYSGESGAGPPHLHFEVRDPGDRPLDPFRAGLPAPDDRQPPVLESLTITAADPGTYLDGFLREKSYPFERRGARHLLRDPVRVSGPFHATLMAHDPVPGGRVGLRFLEVLVDGRPFYRMDFDAFRFDQYPLSGLVHDHRFSHLGPTRLGYRLARLPGNALASGPPPEGSASEEAWSFDLEEGAHRLDLLVRDSAGVVSRAGVCVFVGRPDPVAGTRLLAPGEAVPAGALARFDPIGDSVAKAPPARDRSLPAGDAGDCVPPPDAVEGALWSEKEQRFQPLDCQSSRGLCFARGPIDSMGTLPALRLRRMAGGVPGPWQAVPEPTPVAFDPARLRVDLLPSFVDLLLPAGTVGGVPVPSGQSCPAPVGPEWRPREGGAIGSGVGYESAASIPVHSDPEASDCLLRRGLAGTVLRYVVPTEAARLAGTGFRIDLPAGARFYAGPLGARSVPAVDLPSGLLPIGAAVDVLPEGEALNARAVLSFDVGASAGETQALGIFRYDAVTGRWTFEGDSTEAGAGEMALPFRRHGRFALLRDESPPVLVAVRPASGARLAGPRIDIQAQVDEIGKGLGPDGVSFVLDGSPLESEFDPDRATARPIQAPRLKPGPHLLRVVATDRAGNASAPVETRFDVR